MSDRLLDDSSFRRLNLELDNERLMKLELNLWTGIDQIIYESKKNSFIGGKLMSELAEEFIRKAFANKIK